MPSLAVDNSNITTLQTKRELYQDYLGGGKEALLDTLTKYAYVIYKLRELGSSEKEIKRYVEAAKKADVMASPVVSIPEKTFKIRQKSEVIPERRSKYGKNLE